MILTREQLEYAVKGAQQAKVSFLDRFPFDEVMDILLRFCTQKDEWVYEHTAEQAAAFDSFMTWKAAMEEGEANRIPMYWDDDLQAVRFKVEQ